MSPLRIFAQPLPLLLLLLLLLAGGALCASKDGHYRDVDGDGEEEHDAGFDQRQFLGKERVKEFAGLDEKESAEKLRKMVAEEVDLDKDGFVTEEELLKHLEKVNKEQLASELETQWQELNQSDSSQLDWPTYAKSLHPGLFDESASTELRAAAEQALKESQADPQKIDVAVPEKVGEDDRAMLEEFFRDLLKHRRRWRVADANADGTISKEEYPSLLFPDEHAAMRDVVVAETLESLDGDGDGKVSREEFIADLWRPQGAEKAEPEWLTEERKDFDGKKDANGDGSLDKEEVRAWIYGDGDGGAGRTAKQEAAHLLKEADRDNDGRLSLDEVAGSHELFAGSQVTDFGQAMEGRDEL